MEIPAAAQLYPANTATVCLASTYCRQSLIVICAFQKRRDRAKRRNVKLGRVLDDGVAKRPVTNQSMGRAGGGEQSTSSFSTVPCHTAMQLAAMVYSPSLAPVRFLFACLLDGGKIHYGIHSQSQPAGNNARRYGRIRGRWKRQHGQTGLTMLRCIDRREAHSDIQHHCLTNDC